MAKQETLTPPPTVSSWLGAELAFPSPERRTDMGDLLDSSERGLTKREYMATHIMAATGTVWPWRDGPRAKWAVARADELLEELQK